MAVSFRSTGINPDAEPFEDLTRSGTRRGPMDANPFVGDSPELWQEVVIGTLGGELSTLPGLAKVSGRIAMRKDRQKATGKNGEKNVHLGYEPATVDITLLLWTSQHWETFRKLALKIRPRRPGLPPAFSVSHPALGVYGIGAVEFIEAGFPEPLGDNPDILQVKLRAREYLPPDTDAPVQSNKKATPTTEPGNAWVKKTNAVQASVPPPLASFPPSQTSSGPNPPNQSIGP